MDKRYWRRAARKQPFADGHRNYTLRTRLRKALDFYDPPLDLAVRDTLVEILYVAADAALVREEDYANDQYSKLLAEKTTVRLERNRYKTALERLIGLIREGGHVWPVIEQIERELAEREERMGMVE